MKLGAQNRLNELKRFNFKSSEPWSLKRLKGLILFITLESTLKLNLIGRAQWAGWLLTTTDVRSSNPDVNKFLYLTFINSQLLYWIDDESKEREAGKWPFINLLVGEKLEKPGTDPIKKNSRAKLCYAKFEYSDWLLKLFNQSECLKLFSVIFTL